MQNLAQLAAFLNTPDRARDRGTADDRHGPTTSALRAPRRRGAGLPRGERRQPVAGGRAGLRQRFPWRRTARIRPCDEPPRRDARPESGSPVRVSSVPLVRSYETTTTRTTTY
jgi:hypothetical protein